MNQNEFLMLIINLSLIYVKTRLLWPGKLNDFFVRHFPTENATENY